ncbi:MAG TPA: N-acetyltransferase [Vicinamibacteria bacterium]|nr:N-acetyltransferase [Vicinamibacteria bacterium]
MIAHGEVAIREERPGDEEAIRHVNTLAFGQPEEAQIVDALRSACPEGLSLVAVDRGELIGHILFTPATLAHLEGMGLAPMAVAPSRQREGIGSRLVRAGLAELRARGCPFVVVLGHPEYYPRFGFEPASAYGIRCKWEVPDDAFMILRMDPSRMEGVSGMAHYRDELG